MPHPLVDVLFEPALAVVNPGERVYWLYLLSAVAMALFAYLRLRGAGHVSPGASFGSWLFPPDVYGHVGTWNDLAYFAVNKLLFGLLLGPAVLGGAAVAHATAPWFRVVLGAPWFDEGGPVAAVALTGASVVALDLGLFVAHRLAHRVPVLWEFHKVHHAAQVMTPITVYRMHPVDDLLTISSGALASGLAVGLFDALFAGPVSPIGVFGVNAFTFAFYAFGYNLRHSHVWVDFGRAGNWLLISPAQHQIHHSADPRHFDKNLGFMLSWWDRLAGSLYEPRGYEAITFGLGRGEDRDYASLSAMYLAPFAKVRRLLQRPAPARSKAVGWSVAVGSVAWLVVGVVLSVAPAREGPPPSVELEHLTWTEVDRLVARGYRTAIVPTGGTEQNGPHLVLGKHNFILQTTAPEIARRLGDALVAPVVRYVPEGAVDPPEGHMAFAGTLSVPEPVFEGILEGAARSLAAHGFDTICLVGESGGNQAAQLRVAERLTAEWAARGVVVWHIDAYYAGNGQVAWLEAQGETMDSIGGHAGIRDTSELLAAYPQGVRVGAVQPAGSRGSALGFSGDPTRASPERGAELLELKIAAAVDQIRRLRAERR